MLLVPIVAPGASSPARSTRDRRGLVQELGLLDSIPRDHRNGGPWVMLPDTPYAHIMIPVESYGR